MQIGELSRRCGVSVRMIRYYESQGLLHPARTASGYRRYENAEVALVKRIVALNAAGLALDTIRHILPCATSGSHGFRPCEALEIRVRQKLADLDGQIAALLESRGILAGYLGAD